MYNIKHFIKCILLLSFAHHPAAFGRAFSYAITIIQEADTGTTHR
jgi:hypothetical protein